MNKKLNVLSLFDGLSGCQVALQKLGITPKNYFASEIDEYAKKITMKNFPNTIQLGDVLNWQNWKLPKIDLLIGGFPCQGLSSANNNRQGLQDKRSGLFWTMIDILNSIKPKYFVFENVESMPTKDFVIITNTVGVDPIMLNAGLVSAQRRKRYFWTNIPNIKKPGFIPSKLYPDNKIGLVIADILEENVERKVINIPKEKWIKTSYGIRWNQNKQGIQRQSCPTSKQKSSALTATMSKTLPMIVNTHPQGQSAQVTSEKDFSLVANGVKHKTLIIKNTKSSDQTQNASIVESKVRALDSTIPYSPKLLIDHNSQQNRASDVLAKHPTLPSSRLENKCNIIFDDCQIVQLTWIELERLMGLPDSYTDLGEGNNKVEPRGKAIGNGFQIDIVAHLLSFMLDNPTPIERSKVRLRGEQVSLFD